MRVVNNSQVPAASLRPIIKFLGGLFPESRDVVIFLEGSDPTIPNVAMMTGAAYPDGGWARRLPCRHLVRVHVPTLHRPYPTRQHNPATIKSSHDGCPWVELSSWEDELVLVLAHELRHVEQFMKFSPSAAVADDDGTFEVDAEVLAVNICNSWRENAHRI